MSLDEKTQVINTSVLKEFPIGRLSRVYLKEDLKQSIKELKEKVISDKWEDGDIDSYLVIKAIDEVFGKGLI